MNFSADMTTFAAGAAGIVIGVYAGIEATKDRAMAAADATRGGVTSEWIN